MRVLVLNPPGPGGVRYSRDGRCQSDEGAWLDTFPPTMLASVAGALRVEHQVVITDCIGERLGMDALMERVEALDPDAVVCNTATPTIAADMAALAAVKGSCDALTLAYGEHVTARAAELLKDQPALDVAVLGEAETPVLRALRGEERIPGTAVRGWTGEPWLEPELDTLPFPAYDLLPTYRFPLTGEPWLFVRDGRGCPYNCSFCVMPRLGGRRARFHSSEYMLDQLTWVVERLGIRLWMLWDELATLDRGRMERLCDLLVGSGLAERARWFCTTRADQFDQALAQRMHAAGCRMVSFGVESGSQHVLDRCGKGITVEQVRQAVAAAGDAGMHTIGHCIIGLPGEDEESARATVDLAIESGLDFAQFYTATPFPGSAFHEEAVREGWFVDGDWGAVEQGTAAVSYPHLPAERIAELRREAYRAFYLRPKAAVSVATMTTPRALLDLPRMTLGFLGWMGR
ncbi:MAG: radical SAM protein [Candidatus Undinarchaeales archaeon]|nr:radical SAM protein [Candidatus Undinarchaeales archaeon]MDP7491849.1 radical SAM protein [Candidatus Undinarchaeales archaeon]